MLKLLGLGSIVQATPLLAAMRSRHPEARIVFVTKVGNEQLTDRIPGIDQTLTIRDDGLIRLTLSVFRLLRDLWRTPHACFINLEAHSRLGVVLAILSAAQWKVGFFRNPHDLMAASAFDRLVYFNPAAPISEVYLQLDRALGGDARSSRLTEIILTPADHAEVKRFLTRLGLTNASQQIVLLNPNASELRLERRWDADRFARTIETLAQAEPDLFFVLIGVHSERQYTEAILTAVAPPARVRTFNGAGCVSLGGLLALIGRARLLITNDSGPMHFALSLATPTVGLFGPVDPDHYGSTNTTGRHTFIYKHVYCSPCTHHFKVAPCQGNNVCMQQISVTDVVTASLSMLRAEVHYPTIRREISYVYQGKAIGVARAHA